MEEGNAGREERGVGSIAQECPNSDPSGSVKGHQEVVRSTCDNDARTSRGRSRVKIIRVDL